MTATAAPIACTDCHRPVVRSEPLWMLGHPYGPKCGRRYGLRPERQVWVRRPKETDLPEQPSLLDLLSELDVETEIDEESEAPT